jgi:predicted amidohydrolase YtcJ
MNEKKLERKIFFGGSILTMNDDQPIVQAVGIDGEKILVVGSLEEVKNKIGENYVSINLNGKTLLPGFIDSHFHIVPILFFYVFPNLVEVKSQNELKELLKKSVDQKKPGEFIYGLNLKEEQFENPKERILPNRFFLDEVCPNNPVFLLRYDGHIGIANSKALELAGIKNNTLVPEGGEIRKNEKGDLTGILTENATSLIMTQVSLPDPKEIMEAAARAYKDLAAYGITSIHGVVELDKEGGVVNLGGLEIPLLKTIKDKILQNWYGIVFTAEPKKLKRIKKPPLDEGKIDGRFKIGCLKSWLDGTFGAATALMYKPFSDQPDKIGFSVINEDILYERMVKAHNLNFQIAIHAVGDKANQIVIDLYKKLLKEHPREDHRHRIEHASMLTSDMIKDLKKLGIIASCQPPFINSEYTWLEKRIGKERCKYTYPFKSLTEAGVVIASGSDGPVENPSVIMGLHALVTRNGFIPEECIPIEEALKTYTINGAYAAFEEDVKGSIEVGKFADLVIIDKNPLQVSEQEIKNIQVLETIIRGQTVFKK